MTWKPALPRYSLTIAARRESSSIRRTRSPTMIHQSEVPSTMMPRHPRTTARHPVRDFPALLRIEHFGGVGQGLRDTCARGLRQPDLLGAQTLDCSTIDGGGGQERDRLSARALRLLLQRPQIGGRSLGNRRELDLLVLRCVELDRHVLGHAVDPVIDLRRGEGATESTVIAPADSMPAGTLTERRRQH